MTVIDPRFGRAVDLTPLEEWPALATDRGGDAPVVTMRRRAVRRLVAADATALVVAALVAPLVVAAVSSNPASRANRLGGVFVFDLAMVPVFLATFAVYGLYRSASRRIDTAVVGDLKDIAHALIVGGFATAAIGYGIERVFGDVELTVGKTVALCGIALVLVPVSRTGVVAMSGRLRRAAVPIVVVGTGVMARTVAGHMRAHANVRFLGYVDDNPLDGDGVLGGLDDLPDLCRALGVGRVVVCFSRTHPERTIAMLKSLAGQVAVSIVPRYYELVTIRSSVEDVSGLPLIDVAPASFSPGARFAKRAFDLVASSLALLVLSPFFAATAVLVAATSPGPVFFRQERSGRFGVPFRMLKFRTMVDGAEQARCEILDRNEVDGPLFKVRDDPRVTAVGRFLRRTSLDELPQLFNVWKGDMSLVGPRPFVVAEAQAIEGWARKRFEARPGMTGLWQVSGRNELSYLELCRLDYLYVASWSFWWDTRILWKTPATVLQGRGAS
jgi:exopolysaccharide biosynthesis polyprenyl glycosylphosphotransferase